MSSRKRFVEKPRNNRRRTLQVSTELLQQLAVADVGGQPIRGSCNVDNFDHEKRDEIKEQQLAEDAALREVMVDCLGEDHYGALMDLFVNLSARGFDSNPSKACRRKAEERPFLIRVFLLGLFRTDRELASRIGAKLELWRIKNMAETVKSKVRRSTWTIVSPRTARPIHEVDAWVVAIERLKAHQPSLSETDVSSYIGERADTLFSAQDFYLSVRLVGDGVELGVVKLFADLDRACLFAKSIGQSWIMNVKSQESIEVERAIETNVDRGLRWSHFRGMR